MGLEQGLDAGSQLAIPGAGFGQKRSPFFRRWFLHCGSE
jgi:hypothetical protein